MLASIHYSRFNNSTSHPDRHYRPHKRAKRGPPPGPSECFFCLSNPNLTTHLITSIANNTYLTTARGPLSTSTTYPSLLFPYHILIIPLSYSLILHSITPPETRIFTYYRIHSDGTSLRNTPTFDDTQIKYLADLGRYRMAIKDDKPRRDDTASCSPTNLIQQ